MCILLYKTETIHFAIIVAILAFQATVRIKALIVNLVIPSTLHPRHSIDEKKQISDPMSWYLLLALFGGLGRVVVS